MAHIIQKSSNLQDEYKTLRRKKWLVFLSLLTFWLGLRLVVFLFSFVQSAIFSLFFSSYPSQELLGNESLFFSSLNIFGMIFVPIFFHIRARRYCMEHYGTKDYSSQLRILRSGLDGESLATKTMQRLPEPYVVFSNLHIVYEGQSSEMDFVVVGPTGVYIVETKNHSGTIQGDLSDYNLIQQKIGRGGTPYSNTFYNPVKQVSTHVYRLANLLRTNGMNTYIHSIVYFTQANLQISNRGAIQHTPVFSRLHGGERSMHEYITTQMRTPLSPQEFTNIVNFIGSLPG